MKGLGEGQGEEADMPAAGRKNALDVHERFDERIF